MSGYVEPKDIRESFGKPRCTCIVVAAHKRIIGWVVVSGDGHVACDKQARVVLVVESRLLAHSGHKFVSMREPVA